jgi:hypothetical protein
VIQYAGVALDDHNAELVTEVGARLDQSFLLPALPRSSPGPRLGAFPFRPPPDEPDVRLGVLHWPCHASRYSLGNYLVTDAGLATIREAVYGTSGPGHYDPAPLVVSDGVDSVTFAEMYMLPPKPLCQIEGTNNLWWLRLVDDRFFWWNNDSTLTAPTSWDDLFSQIAAALGFTLGTDFFLDTVPAAYLSPPSAFAVTNGSLPIILDGACMSVGARLVANHDGSYRVIRPENATTVADANDLLGPPVDGGGMELTP